MDLKKLENLIKKEGHSSFRLKQAQRAVYFRLVGSWQEATDLPEDLRALLENNISISGLQAVSVKESAKKDTVKVLFKTHDGYFIEAVLMKHLSQKKPAFAKPACRTGRASAGEDNFGRNTVCVSSQAGCPMACAFCATGKMGFKRSLSAEEIADQVLHFARILKKDPSFSNDTAGKNEKVNNIVFMGMGEPFHNYDNLIESIKVLNNKDGFNLGARHISVSTCGIVPGIKKFADENIQANLAISLHAPNDNIRSKIMPVNKAYNIKKLLDAVDYYIKKTNRKVMFEYILIDGVNDSEKEALELARLMNKKLYHINLIKYHSIGLPAEALAKEGVFKASSQEKMRRFFDILKKNGVSVTFRISFGEDISAACGQLAQKNL